jgi:NAD(P)-dependent dehydrogenase (short-subunit alcohol dehydrogenase family)
MSRVDEFDWASFSEAWNVDVKASFLLIKEALTLPLSPGSSVVVVSSGAAMDGSPLSGGYAGAKRMQWFLADYAQKVSNTKKLGSAFSPCCRGPSREQRSVQALRRHTAR